jgi:DNA-directed RNA polymerase subunit RPC12/RpoP
MTIKFQCSLCGKKIEAPDSSGGKWGKCPGCHNKVYVPQPVTEEDELKLAPLDETEEQRQRQLMLETLQITRDILQEKASPDGPAGPTPGSPSDINEEKLTDLILRYLRQMANGDLDDAQRTAEQILPHRRKATLILDRLVTSKEPDPELEDIPKQVLLGYIRNLRTRLS